MGQREGDQKLPRLSEMEWEIMKPLWRHGPLAARDVFAHVPDSYGWAYETVKSMLLRLVKKGAIEYDRVGNSYLYRAAHTRREMSGAATRSFIRRVFDGGLTPFYAQFIEESSAEEIAFLKEQLARHETAKKPKKGK